MSCIRDRGDGLYYTSNNKKQRGQRRKLKRLLKYIDEFIPFEDTQKQYEHFHVPCRSDFLNSRKTSSKIRTAFVKKWVETVEKFISEKPKDIPFCKVVGLVSEEDLWESQIIIFYDDYYYNNFWNRNWGYQTWTQINNRRSLKEIYRLGTSLNELCYEEKLVDEDDSTIFYTTMWFYME